MIDQNKFTKALTAGRKLGLLPLAFRGVKLLWKKRKRRKERKRRERLQGGE